MAEPKYSKECPDCTRRFPIACAVTTCLACKTVLVTTQKAPTVEEAEFKLLSYVHGRVIPGPLKEDDQRRWDADWETLDQMVELATPWLSAADLFAAWPSVRPAA